MAAWTADNATPFRSAMKVGVAKLCEMIAADLQGEPLSAVATHAAAGADRPAVDGVLARQADGSLLFKAN